MVNVGVHADRLYDMGEAEDYKVIVDNPVLAIPLLSFEAQTEKNKQVDLDWSSTKNPISGIQPSAAAMVKPGKLSVLLRPEAEVYRHIPAHRFRIRIRTRSTGSNSTRVPKPVRYSNVKSVKLKDLTSLIESTQPRQQPGVVRLDGDFSEQVASLSLTDAREQSFRKQVVMVWEEIPILIPLTRPGRPASIPSGYGRFSTKRPAPW